MLFFGLLIAYPWLALIPAAGFAALYAGARRRRIAVTAVLWALYAGYEYGMHQRWLCTGECNIRVDLLLIDPLLAVMSILALVAAWRAHGRRTMDPGMRRDDN